MSTAYKPVGWNRNKLIYDAVLLAGVVVYILLYLKLAPLLLTCLEIPLSVTSCALELFSAHRLIRRSNSSALLAAAWMKTTL